MIHLSFSKDFYKGPHDRTKLGKKGDYFRLCKQYYQQLQQTFVNVREFPGCASMFLLSLSGTDAGSQHKNTRGPTFLQRGA